MEGDVCNYLIDQLYFCSNPTDPSPSNNREYLKQGMYYIVTGILKSVNTYLSSQITSESQYNDIN